MKSRVREERGDCASHASVIRVVSFERYHTYLHTVAQAEPQRERVWRAALLHRIWPSTNLAPGSDEAFPQGRQGWRVLRRSRSWSRDDSVFPQSGSASWWPPRPSTPSDHPVRAEIAILKYPHLPLSAAAAAPPALEVSTGVAPSAPSCLSVKSRLCSITRRFLKYVTCHPSSA